MRIFAGLLAALALLTPAWAEPVPASGTMEVAFSPWDDAEGLLLRTIASARKTLYVQAFLFTSRPLGAALIDAHKRGIAVAVLADREMMEKGDNSQIPKFAAAGIPVWLEVRYQSAHNKIMLVDPEEEHNAVVTGSYNFTWSAQARNAENLLVLRDNAPLARAYLANWKRHRGDAVPYAAEPAR